MRRNALAERRQRLELGLDRRAEAVRLLVPDLHVHGRGLVGLLELLLELRDLEAQVAALELLAREPRLRSAATMSRACDSSSPARTSSRSAASSCSATTSPARSSLGARVHAAQHRVHRRVEPRLDRLELRAQLGDLAAEPAVVLQQLVERVADLLARAARLLLLLGGLGRGVFELPAQARGSPRPRARVALIASGSQSGAPPSRMHLGEQLAVEPLRARPAFFFRPHVELVAPARCCARRWMFGRLLRRAGQAVEQALQLLHQVVRVAVAILGLLLQQLAARARRSAAAGSD